MSVGPRFTAGAAAAIAAFALAGVFLKPGFEHLAVIAQEADPEGTRQHEAERLERRLRPISLIQVALLVFAVAVMATARYLP